MQISDIHNEIQFLTGADNGSYSEAQRVRHINAAYQKLQARILLHTGALEYDDFNHADLAEETINLVSGTREYEFREDNGNNQILTIHKVGILDDSGDYRIIQRANLAEPNGRYLVNDTTSRYPNKYWEQGPYIVLDPIPNTNVTNGLKVWYDRGITPFETGQTTEEPALPEFAHMLLALYPAKQYAVAKGLQNAGNIQTMIDDLEEELEEWYGYRRRDELPIITTTPTRSW